ncbi:hypothetical protein QJQ45_029919 [Haematococcus lacustris]|nr:hypothetical protein QJQ45_029919 [Haematococcus lacustris]
MKAYCRAPTVLQAFAVPYSPDRFPIPNRFLSFGKSGKRPAMDQFVVRGISAADAAANRHRELLIHDEQRFQMSLDRQAAVIEKRLPRRPRKLSNFGPYPSRNPAASPSTPPALSRTGKAHENWWHPARIQPILRAVPACGGYSPAVKHLKLVQPDLYSKLDESTVRGWYQKGSLTQLTEQARASLFRGAGHHHVPTAGTRATLGNYLPLKVEIKDRLKALREGGVALNHVTARSIMMAIIQQREPQLLASNGGLLYLSAHFVRDFLENQLNWVTRKGTGDSQHLPANWQRLVDDMNMRAALLVFAKGVPPELFYSMDETFVFFAPMAGSTTLAEQGSKQVYVAASEQKKGITVCLTVKASRHVLPMQLIYEGKTDLSTPGGKPKHVKAWQPLPARVAADAAGHDVTATPSHWATEDSHKQLFERVLLPDYKRTCAARGYDLDGLPVARWPAMIYQLDVYAVHRKRSVLDWFLETYPFVHFLFVPAGTTPVAQVLDTAINRPFKHNIKQSFIQDSVQQISKQLHDGAIPAATKLDLSSSYLKPLSLMWALTAHQHISGMSDLVISGYKNAGTLRAFDVSYQQAAVSEMQRLFPVPLREAPPAVPESLMVFVEEQNAGAAEDDAAVQPSDLHAALQARPAGKPLPSMSLPMEDSPLVTEPAAVLNIALMTAEELMSAALQLASTRSAPAAMKPAVAKAGPALRKRGRPLGSKNKPKPAAIGPASATPQRKQVRLRITSSSGNSDSSDLNSTDNVSCGSSSSSSEGEAGQAGAKAGAVGQARVATRVATLPRGRSREVGTAGAKAGLTSPARVATRLANMLRGEAAGHTRAAGQGGVLALAKAAAWVAAGARKFECSEEDDEICRHCQQRQEDHDFMSEVHCPM